MKGKRLLAIILSVAMVFVVTACGSSQGNSSSSSSSSSETASSTSGDTVTVTDIAGREVEIPATEDLERVYSTDTNVFCMQYILDPDRIASTGYSPSEFTEDDLPYIREDMVGLGTCGTLSGQNGVLDYEAIKEANIQFVIKSCESDTNDDMSSDIEDANDLQEQLDIPVILLSTTPEDMADSFTILGEALGKEDEAKEVVDYYEGIVDEVETAVDKVPEEDRPTLYYAEGSDGLSTEPGSSQRSYVFNTCGTTNVATVEALEGFGQSSVSMEALLDWDPEVIVVQGEADSGAYDTITTSSDWANITAVKNGDVYQMPDKPFGWADRPPGVNRYIGLLWLADVLYPEEMNIDLTERVIEYYDKIYHVTITEDDVTTLLKNATKETKE